MSVDKHVPDLQRRTKVNEGLVMLAKTIMQREWPDEFGDKPVEAAQTPVNREERRCLLRARIREAKGWDQPEEERKARRQQLNALLDERWGPHIPGSNVVGTKINVPLVCQTEEQTLAWKKRRLNTLLDQEFGPVLPAGQTSRKPVLRLIQGGRKS